MRLQRSSRFEGRGLDRGSALGDLVSDVPLGREQYLTHYGFVMWLQYALLPAAIPAAANAAIVLSCTLAASWATTAALRRNAYGIYG
jgi:hypothetical protein